MSTLKSIVLDIVWISTQVTLRLPTINKPVNCDRFFFFSSLFLFFTSTNLIYISINQSINNDESMNGIVVRDFRRVDLSHLIVRNRSKLITIDISENPLSNCRSTIVSIEIYSNNPSDSFIRFDEFVSSWNYLPR